MTSIIFRGKPDAGNPHVRFDEGNVASAKPRRGPQLSKNLFFLFFVLPLVAVASEVTATAVTAQQRYPWNGLVDITVTFQCAACDVSMVECRFAATNSATKTALPVTHVTRNGADTGSGSTWTRKYIWDTNAGVGRVKIDDIALAVEAKMLGGVQLWEDGPFWAECNVGAIKPEEYGYYFWWGDTVGYKRNSANDGWVSVKDGSPFSFSEENCPTYWTGRWGLESMGYIDGTALAGGSLVAAHDAATVHLGVPWRMPTHAELSELINNCDTEWTTRNGVEGRLVKGRGAYASKSIFLPAAGFGHDSILGRPGSLADYWSSSINSDDSASRYTWELGFDSFDHSSDFVMTSHHQRDWGCSVRPVRGFVK